MINGFNAYLMDCNTPWIATDIPINTNPTLEILKAFTHTLIISFEEANKLIKRIPKIDPIEDINEKNLETKYKEMLNTGIHENLIRIIKTTYLRNERRINNKKKISEKDDTYFKLAEKYLYNELSISLNMTVEEVKKHIFEIVNSDNFE